MTIRRMCCVAVLLTVILSTSAALDWQRGNATQYARITTDGRSIHGAISPDGTTVAFVSYRKDFSEDGLTYFHRWLKLCDGGVPRTLAALTDTEPAPVDEHNPYEVPGMMVRWLPSGSFLVVDDWSTSGAVLVRIADGAATKVGRIPGWFVLNDDWAFPHQDALALNRALQSSSRWPGESLHPRDLADCVPRESEDWYYQRFIRSPSDPDTALYVASEKHFKGCSCTAYGAWRYLGVVELRTGRMKRLTWGDDHTVARGPVSWTPDGSAICYLRRPYEVNEKGYRYLAGSDLHIIHPDGSHDRHLCANVESLEWLDERRVLVSTCADPLRGPGSIATQTPQQLAIVDVKTGGIQRLTAGNFHHRFLDAADDTYLVCEQPVGAGACRGDLCLIRPL